MSSSPSHPKRNLACGAAEEVTATPAFSAASNAAAVRIIPAINFAASLGDQSGICIGEQLCKCSTALRAFTTMDRRWLPLFHVEIL